MKARLYYFNKQTRKQDERAFDKLYRDLHCVTRANDPSKVLADNALTMLTNLVAMLLASKSGTICVNQDFLSDITGKEADQNANLLKQLKDVISYKYHRLARFEGKRYNYCYIIEFSEDGKQRASNPELFYTIDSKINLVRRGKKFGLIAEKIRASYIDIRETKREREEEALAYSSSLSPCNEDTRVRTHEAEIVQITNIKPEPTPQKTITEIPTLATGYPTEPAKVYQTEEIRVEATEEIKNDHQLESKQVSGLAEEKGRYQSHKQRKSSSGISLLQDVPMLADLLAETIETYEEITEMKAEQIQIEPERNMEFELSGAIFKSFGSIRSNEIMENCKFIQVSPNKLGVQVSNGFSLSANDKDTLKACIRQVHGDSISIVSSAVVKIAQSETKFLQEPLNKPKIQKWEQFKKELLSFFPEKTGDHILNTWFDKLKVSEDVPNNRIILTGSTFYVDSVYNRFQSAIESVVKKQKVTLELHYENNSQRPIIYKPNGGF
jgi:flagellar biosynthesis chaperone FliJ